MFDNKPIISVIVPIYKTEKYLEKCVHSILNQVFENFELILVDDGSPDDCPRMCDEYARVDKRIRVIHKENGGLVSARIAGVNSASGKYITFVDSDDWISKEHLLNAVTAIQEKEADIISCGYSFFSGNNNIAVYNQVFPVGYYDKKQLENEVYKEMISCDEKFYTFGVFPNLCFKFIKKELVAKAQKKVPSNITIGEDAAITYKCLLDAESLQIIDDCGYYYRNNPNSMMNAYDKTMMDKVLILLNYMKDYLNDYKYMEKQFKQYSLMLILKVIENEKKSCDMLGSLKEFRKNKCVNSSLKLSFLKPYKKNRRNLLRTFCFKYHLYYGLKFI